MTLRPTFAALLLLAPLAPLAAGGTLVPRHVAADARWVFHVDVEALVRSSALGVLAEAGHDVRAEIDVGELKSRLGLDPFTDLRSATLYCAGPSSEDVVAVLATSRAVDEAAIRVEALGARKLDLGGRTVHVLGEGDDAGYAALLPGADADQRLVVLGRSEGLLLRGLAVLESRAPSLAEPVATSVRTRPAPGSIVFAAAGQSLSELVDLEQRQASTVARLAQSFSFDLGEERETLFADLRIETQSPEDALRVQQVGQGLVALLALAGQDPKVAQPLQRLTSALRVEAAGTRVQASFRYSVRSLVDELRSLGHHDGEDDGGN
jgi:hypothetical protein